MHILVKGLTADFSEEQKQEFQKLSNEVKEKFKPLKEGSEDPVLVAAALDVAFDLQDIADSL